MKPIIPRIYGVAVLVILCFSLSRSLWGGEFTPAILPPCPPGCKIHVYGPLKRIPTFIPKEAQRTSDWTSYFKAVGLAFEKGGFAYYHLPTKTLIVATTQPDFDLIETVMSER